MSTEDFPLSVSTDMRQIDREMPNPLKTNIERLLADRKTSKRKASLEITDGRNPDLIAGMLRHDVKSPGTRILKQIADYLGVSIEDLVSEGGAAESSKGPTPHHAPFRSSEVRPADVPTPNRDDMALDLPVYGTAAGSLVGSFHFEGGVIDYVRRPPGLTGAKGVYALFVTGDSMDPEHPHGELRFVHPGRPPGPGDTVIVQCKYREDGPIEAYIKRLVRRNADKLVTRQTNPAAEIEFELKTVVAVHKVLTMNEMFGL